MMSDEREPVDDLLQLLERERCILLEGALQEIEPLVEEKTLLMEELAQRETVDAEELGSLQAKLQRNQELYDSALAGVRAVAKRLDMMRTAGKSMNIYTANGEREIIEGHAQASMEKRA
ncbi:flagellar protein FlgN [Salipiger mucosus]|uniref:FlgN protein n=1 Tax=Salipiger mucosus DSM 16094 TaxID=1123237 RepID=S9S8Q9_9RHOB|nr:flagellar protein FlgN [Salipiger mucosus]EPX82609.1 hypothetical protein Salmuc_00928 [Salipiger mucosus DSM 16094]